MTRIYYLYLTREHQVQIRDLGDVHDNDYVMQLEIDSEPARKNLEQAMQLLISYQLERQLADWEVSEEEKAMMN